MGENLYELTNAWSADRRLISGVYKELKKVKQEKNNSLKTQILTGRKERNGEEWGGGGPDSRTTLSARSRFIILPTAFQSLPFFSHPLRGAFLVFT